uniref:stalk domain-containing protein n=1 Tax=Ezakiella massiliensis TaxID=1852374 RepID=UPI0012FE8648|nr:stalk domain-containing protein [Ezakiella massiliensis]
MKRFISLALVFVLLASSFAFAAEASEPVKAEGAKTFQEVYLDGGKVDLGAYLINQRNYVKLRDVAALLTATDAKFNVGFNEDKKVVITTGEAYEKLDTDLVELPEGKVEALMGEQAFVFNGEEKMVKTALINQNNYLQLRELGELIGFGVHYNEETKAIELSSKVEEKAEEAKENTEEKKDEKAEEKKDEKAEEKKEEVEAFTNETGVELKEEAIAGLVEALKAKAAEKELGEVKNITVTKAKESKVEDKVVFEYEGTIATAEKKAKFDAKLVDGKFEIELSELDEKIEDMKEKVEEKAKEKEEAEKKIKDMKEKVEEKAKEKEEAEKKIKDMKEKVEAEKKIEEIKK